MNSAPLSRALLHLCSKDNPLCSLQPVDLKSVATRSVEPDVPRAIDLKLRRRWLFGHQDLQSRQEWPRYIVETDHPRSVQTLATDQDRSGKGTGEHPERLEHAAPADMISPRRSWAIGYVAIRVNLDDVERSRPGCQTKLWANLPSQGDGTGRHRSHQRKVDG